MGLFFYVNSKSQFTTKLNLTLKLSCFKKEANIPASMILGLEITKSGRSGNCLIGLMRAFQYCRVFHLRYIIVPPNFLFINESFTIQGIKIIPKIYEIDYSSYIFKFPFFYSLHSCPVNANFEDFGLFKNFLNSRYSNLNLNKDDLYIHIRSGDVFIKHPNPSLGQPPLNYYLDIINSRKWNKVHVIAENDNNPCIKELAKRGYLFSKGSLHNDMSVLVNAVNLVVGPGSFGQAIVLLSKKLKTYYAYGYYMNFTHSSWDTVHLCRPDDLYSKKLLGKWQNTEEQRQMMIISNCSRWDVMPRTINKK